IVPYCMELGEVECEGPAPLFCEGIPDSLLSKPRELLIVEFEVDGLGSRQLVQQDEWCERIHALLPVLVPCLHVHAVHEGVCKRGRKPPDGFGGECSADKVELRGEDCLALAEPVSGKVLDGLP